MGGFRALDAALMLAVNRLPHPPAADRHVSVLSDLGRGAGWAALCAVIAWKGDGRGRRAAVWTIVAMLSANAVVQGPMKRIFARRRPFHDRHDHVVVGTRTLDTSFPSGHTASSFAAAASLAVAYPGYAPLLLSLSTAVGFSRIYLGHHYPSDVAAGAIVGLAFGAAAALTR